MSSRFQKLAFGALALLPLANADEALAKTFTVQSITPGGSLGRVAQAPSATSTLTLSTGGVLSVSGGAAIFGATTDVYTVTIKCANGGGLCPASPEVFLSVNSSTGCLQTITAFTEGNGTETVGTVGGTTLAPTFNLTPNIANGSTGTFVVGFTAPLKSAAACTTTGAATTTFTVGVAKSGAGSATSSLSSSPSITVYRPIAVSSTANMAFGSIVKPATGSGTVTLSNGNVLTTSSGTILTSTSHTVAGFSVTGEGGEAFTLTVPTTFVMTSGTNSLTVSTLPTASGTQTLSSSVGSAGSLTLAVGGTFPISTATVNGAYTGNLVVTVAYN